MAFPQPDRDAAELRGSSGPDDDAATRSLLDDRAHEAARRDTRLHCELGLLHRQRLAGEHRFVALELGDVEQANVGGNDVADAELHDVARHQRHHVDRLRGAVADDERGVPDLRCATPRRRVSDRYSLKKPRPTDPVTITPMITASVPEPVKPDTVAAPSRRISNGLRSWRTKTAHGRAPWLRSAFGPYCEGDDEPRRP